MTAEIAKGVDRANDRPHQDQTENQHAHSDADEPNEQQALARLCTKLPKSYPDWDYQTTVNFKAALAKALRVSKSRRPGSAAIQEQTRALEQFHGAGGEPA